MITPRFRVEQDNENLYVLILNPIVKSLAQVEIFHENNEFIFHAAPYFLRLEFPAPVKCSDQEQTEQQQKASYDAETNRLRILIPKQTPGEHFPNLEMIDQLLAQPKTKLSKKLIEVLNATGEEVSSDEDDEEFDWTIEQRLLPRTIEELALSDCYSFGFSNSRIYLPKLDPETAQMFDCQNPGLKTVAQRREERLRKENKDFSEEHYLADLFGAGIDDDQSLSVAIESMIEARAPWENDDDALMLDDRHRQRIAEHIPPQEFRLEAVNNKALWLGLFDILYAYCYDLRTNDFEHTVESSWTIRKLSPTLSWFEYWIPTACDNCFYQHGSNSRTNDGDNHPPPMYKLTLAGCIRRALIYPLYRHWGLSIKVANDVINIMSRGRNAILRCLLDVHEIMSVANLTEFNELYLTDYCAWIAPGSKKKSDRGLQSLTEHMAAAILELDKDQIGLDLPLLERAARAAMEEESTSQGIQTVLDIGHHRSDSDDDE